jgi:hypothetical protein
LPECGGSLAAACDSIITARRRELVAARAALRRSLPSDLLELLVQRQPVGLVDRQIEKRTFSVSFSTRGDAAKVSVAAIVLPSCYRSVTDTAIVGGRSRLSN